MQMWNWLVRPMASLSNSSLASPTASPARALLLGAALLAAIPFGLQMMTAHETSFYRTHGMVADARTAVRLAQMVVEGDHRGCALPDDAAAQLQGEIWTVEARPAGGGSLCRVEIDRKDGQILRVETHR
jgi:hypothetical protein